MQRITAAQIAEMRSNGYDRSRIAEAEALLELGHEADKLIAEIAIAFADVRLEDGVGLYQADGIDDYRGPDELAKLRERDEKDDWRKISGDSLNKCHASPSFFDAKGLLFHLPAFLTSELRGEHHQDFIGRLMRNMFSAENYESLLDNRQREVIQKVLRFEYENFQYFYEDPGLFERALLRFQPKPDLDSQTPGKLP